MSEAGKRLKELIMMKMKRIRQNLQAVILSAALAFTGAIPFGAGAVSAQGTGREARIEANELVAAIGEEPETGFDPSTGSHGSITRLFFSTLFRRDKELGWESDLATGYEVSEDKLTWTVTIRDDAYFTDGSKVTAGDVVFTYLTAKDAGGDIDLTMIESAEAPDDTTAVFHLTRVYSPFIERLAYLGIVPEASYNEQFKDNPVGSGPYKLVQWDKGQQVIAEANEDYYGDAPAIKRLTLVFLDMDTACAAVNSGDVDVAQINGLLADVTSEGTHIENIASIECYGVAFPMQPAEGKLAEDGAEIGNAVTCDPAVRKAFNMAVDRQKMVDGILNGYGTVSTTGLEKMPWLNEDTMLGESQTGDVEGAKALLEEAGWTDSNGDGTIDKDGVEGTFRLLYTDGVYRQELGLEFVNVGKQLGFDVRLEKVTWDTILPDIHKEAVMYGFGSGDPSELFNLYYGPNAGGVVPWDNGGCYVNEKCDAEIDAALESMDEAEALTHWKAMQEYSGPTGDAPYCWLVNANHVYLAADGFSFGEPVVQPHGGRIFDNITEWHWEA